MPKKKKRGTKPRPRKVTPEPTNQKWNALKGNLPLVTIWVILFCIVATCAYIIAKPDNTEPPQTVVMYETDNGQLHSSLATILQRGDKVQFQIDNDAIIERSNLDVIISDTRNTGFNENDPHQTFHINRYDASGITKSSATIDGNAYKVEQDPNCENNPGLIIYDIDRIYYVAEQYVTFDATP